MHVAPAEIATRPWWLRWLLTRQRRRYGDTLLPARVWARVPALYAALAAFYAAIERQASPLPPLLRSLVQIRVSQLNDCAFCVDLNAALAAERAGAADKALAVASWREDPRFDDRERLALEYAEAMTVTGAAADARLIEKLHAVFGEEGLIELTALIAFQNLSSKFNAALDVPSQGLCRLPAQAAGAAAAPVAAPPA